MSKSDADKAVEAADGELLDSAGAMLYTHYLVKMAVAVVDFDIPAYMEALDAQLGMPPPPEATAEEIAQAKQQMGIFRALAWTLAPFRSAAIKHRETLEPLLAQLDAQVRQVAAEARNAGPVADKPDSPSPIIMP